MLFNLSMLFNVRFIYLFIHLTLLKNAHYFFKHFIKTSLDHKIASHNITAVIFTLQKRRSEKCEIDDNVMCLLSVLESLCGRKRGASSVASFLHARTRDDLSECE